MSIVDEDRLTGEQTIAELVDDDASSEASTDDDNGDEGFQKDSGTDDDLDGFDSPVRRPSINTANPGSARSRIGEVKGVSQWKVRDKVDKALGLRYHTAMCVKEICLANDVCLQVPVD